LGHALAPNAPVRHLSAPRGNGLPLPVLTHELDTAVARLEAVTTAPLPETPDQLVAIYSDLGHAQALAEACLLSTVDALDPKTGGGVSEPAAAYGAVRSRAFEILRDAGRQYARIEPAFGSIVHGDNGWVRQPIEVEPDRGDGHPLNYYVNTYKHMPGLTPEQRHAEHDERVESFGKKGGRFEDILTAEIGTLDQLNNRLRYDYVMLPDGTLRLYPNAPDGHGRDVKPGHSLLATGGPEFIDEPVLLAGEIWIYKDTAGKVEAIVVANNSGHFKPEFEDLKNAIEPIERLGLPRNKIVLFGGPNNLPSMFKEIVEHCTTKAYDDPSAMLPPDPEAILESLGHSERQTDLVSVRTW
ncbi:MAG: hypothetical protein V3T05_08470, partial [Myxococcota bacterium]